MATDIFGRDGQQFGGSFAADAARIVFSTGGATVGTTASAGSTNVGVPGDLIGGSGGVGLLTQSVQISYTQQVSRLYEIGSNYTFLVGGRTQGQLSLGRVLGPRPVQIQFYKNYGNVCNAATNNINFEMDTGCQVASTAGALTQFGQLNMYLFNVVLTSIGLSIGVQDMQVNEQVSGMFVAMDIKT